MYPDLENVNKKPLSRLSHGCDCTEFHVFCAVCRVVQLLICGVYSLRNSDDATKAICGKQKFTKMKPIIQYSILFECYQNRQSFE